MKALDKKKLWREIERDLKRKARARLVELRQAIRHARASHKEKLARAVSLCRSARGELAARLKAERIATMERLRETAARARLEARSACAASKMAARADLPRARSAYVEERREQKRLRQIERENRRLAHAASAAVRAGARRAEHRQESDSAVLQNIPPELVPLWKRVGRSIRGSARQSRTEAFLRYAEEHPREVVSAVEVDAEEKLARLLAQQEHASRAMRRGRYRDAAAYSEVPF